ncbi:GerAB/ArcD/ProY family transporter, partial [Paenibacillus sp. TAF58]
MCFVQSVIMLQEFSHKERGLQLIKQLISTRQATMWFTLYQLGSALLILPAALAGISKQDAWISVVVAIGLFLSFSPVYI